MTAFRKAGEAMFLSPQLQEADFAAAANSGVTMIVNNRPDGEAPDQLSSEQARSAAEAAGLSYEYVPADMGALSMAMVEAMEAALDRATGPVLAYCTSGMRSALLWALVRAKKGDAPEGILAATRSCGYELGQYQGLLEAVGQK